MGEPSEQAKSIFLAALEEHAPEQWPAFLEQACAGDDSLRKEVQSLIDSHEHAGSFIETPAADLALAALIARAALLRTESRGAHFRIDAPEPDPVWRGRIVWRRGHVPGFEEVPSA